MYANLDRRHEGDEVDVDITDTSGGTNRRSVTLGAPRGDATATPTLGEVRLLSLPLTLGRLPFPVSLDTAGEGGPSAGLALTLGLLNRLGPAPIMGPVRVAMTGTIAPDGTSNQVWCRH